MINQNIFKLLSLTVVYFCLLVIDAAFGVHTFAIGLLLSLAFFIPMNQVFVFTLLLGFFDDVLFVLPLGVSAVLLIPYLFIFQRAIKVVRSRMLFLFFYLCCVSSLISLIEYKQFIQPSCILGDIVTSGIFIVVLYIYAIRRFQDFSFSTSQKPLRF